LAFALPLTFLASPLAFFFAGFACSSSDEGLAASLCFGDDGIAAAVRVSHEDGVVAVEVADDGIGGADPDRGSGLRGLVDRVAALDGTLRVDSPAGGGTRIVAELPVREHALTR